MGRLQPGARTARVYLVPGTSEPGVWCDTCMSHSAVRVSFSLVGDTYKGLSGVADAGAGVFCPGCMTETYEPPGGDPS